MLQILIILLTLLFVQVNLWNSRLFGQEDDATLNNLAVKFNGKYGQVEVGGNFVGAEFHHSRSLPSRISFYYPVANSIDLSTDYWKRDESQPFRIRLNFNGQIEEIESHCGKKGKDLPRRQAGRKKG